MSCINERFQNNEELLRICVSLLVDVEEWKPHTESRDTAVLAGTVYVSFAIPQNTAGGPFEILHDITGPGT